MFEIQPTETLSQQKTVNSLIRSEGVFCENNELKTDNLL
jgi:hypothetical protein